MRALVIAPTLPNPDGKRLSEKDIVQTKRNIEKSLGAEDIDFEVLKMKSNKREEIIVVVHSKDDQTNTLFNLQEKGSQLGLSVTERKSKLPRLIVRNVPNDTAPFKILESIASHF